MTTNILKSKKKYNKKNHEIMMLNNKSFSFQLGNSDPSKFLKKILKINQVDPKNCLNAVFFRKIHFLAFFGYNKVKFLNFSKN